MNEYIVAYNIASDTEDFDDYDMIFSDSFEEAYSEAFKKLKKQYDNYQITIVEVYQRCHQTA